MRTIRTKVYQFNELSKDAQQTAIKNYLATNYENIELYDFALDCSEYASEKGFKDAKVRYSLSYSQGDGLSFDADIDIERFLREFKPNVKQSIVDCIINNCYACCEANTGHYAYSRKDDISLNIDANGYKEYNNVTELLSNLKLYIQDCYMEVCGTLESNGYAELEYQDSEEYAIEAIKSNGYEFTIDGKQF